MSVARPAARSLFLRRLVSVAGATAASTITAPAPSRSAPPTTTCHQFHSSAKLAARRRSRFTNVRAVEMGLMNEEKVNEFTKETFPRYTPAEIAELRKVYSKEQLAAIQAGEAAIDAKDLTIQGRLRVDPYRMPYIDDFSHNLPVVDKRVKRNPPPNPDARFMNLDEFTQDMINWADKFRKGDVTGTLKKLQDFAPQEWRNKNEGQWPGDVRKKAQASFMAYLEAEAVKKPADVEAESHNGPTDADFLEYILERSSMTDKNQIGNSSLALALPHKVPGVAGKYKQAVDPEDHGLDDTGVYQELKKRTGMSVREILNLQNKVLVHRFVSNQTRMGKIASHSVLCIAGNGNGWLGIGEAKSTDNGIATQQAKIMAVRNMRPIRRYENRTIFGNVEEKVGAAVVRLYTRPPGFGLRVSHKIFEMCRAAGIQDLASKFVRSRNPMNTVKAAFNALVNQPDPEEIAIGRGKKFVDVRKVYYGGNVL